MTTFSQTSQTRADWKSADRLEPRELQGIPIGQLVLQDFCTIRKTVGWGDPKCALNAAEYSGSEGTSNRHNLFANLASTGQLEAHRSPQNTRITWCSEKAENVKGISEFTENRKTGATLLKKCQNAYTCRRLRGGRGTRKS